jgi:hypothetical protein
MTSDDSMSSGKAPDPGYAPGRAGDGLMPGGERRVPAAAEPCVAARTTALPNPVTAAGLDQDAAGQTGPDPDAEDRRWEEEERAAGERMAARRGAGKGRLIADVVIMTLAGMGLRSHVIHTLPAVAAVTAALAIVGVAMQEVQLRHAGQPEPPWVKELAAYRAWLPRRSPAVPAATLAAADRYLAELPGRRWRSAQLFVPRRPAGKWIPMGELLPEGNRLQVRLGDHVALGPPQVAAATLAHEARHARGWRYSLELLLNVTRARGFLIAGWAVPWPAVLPVVVAVQAGITAAMWVSEISCDLGAAADVGLAAMMDTFEVMTASARSRPAAPWPQRCARQAVHLAAGRRHPPIPVRRAIVRAGCALHPRLAQGRTPPGDSPATRPARDRSMAGAADDR